MRLDQLMPLDPIVNFKFVHVGDWPSVSSNMTDRSPEDVSIVARTQGLQGFGTDPDHPTVLRVY